MSLDSGRHERAPARIPMPLLIAGSVFLLTVIVRNAWVGEDSYITFRTIDNLMHGYGLRWNIDERVQTFTHPLWMMLIALFYRVTGEPYFTSLVISMALSMGAVLIIATRIATDRAAAMLGLLALILSKAFVDYSTGGLENPLTHFLLAVFFLVYFTHGPGIRRIRRLSFLAALLVLNRHDNALMVLPALAVALWTDFSRRAVVAAVVGSLPLIAWETFAVMYYGFPFPNTAYAKLQTGIPLDELLKQGFEYLLDSILVDPVTLTAMATVAVACIAFRRRPLWVLVAGIGLYVAYVLRAGGDFMSGRFLAAPLVCAVIAGSRLDGVLDDRSMAVASLALIVLGVSAPLPTVTSGAAPITGWIEANGITDERRYHYQWTGLLRLPRDGPWPDLRTEEGNEARTRGQRSILYNNIGRVGFGVGPEFHMIDNLALSDPLLARLPAVQRKWRVGHYQRELPEGYQQTIESGVNHIADPKIAALYDDLWRITSGPIWDRARWRAILRLNLGLPSSATAAESPLPTLVPAFTISPDPCTLSGPSAVADCVIDGSRSDSKKPIASFRWSYLGTTAVDNARLNLPLTCANAGATKTAAVPVTLTVRDAAGLERSVTKQVNVVKINACGF